MTAPEPRPGGLDGNVRGLLVIGAAVIVGVLLLLNAGGGSSGGSEDDVAAGTATTTTLVDDAETGTTTTTTAAETGRAPSEVKVVVLNGSGQTGAAGSSSDTLGEAGYTMGTPGNAASTESTTVYYAEGYQAEAIAVAEVLGKGTDATAPLSEASLGGAEGDANVVVVLGTDTPPVGDDASSTSTTTTLSGN